MAVTLRDVAELAGVSFKTVSNVVNGYPHVRPATRAKVERAIAELGYQPNLSARSLRSGRTGAIALAVPELNLSYFAELAGLVIAAAERDDLLTLVVQTDGERDRELALLRNPRLRMTDGLLLSPLGMRQDDADALDVPFPLVILGEPTFEWPTDHVTMRNVEATRAGTEYLIESGRRRVAVIGEHEHDVIGSARLRLRGYREALEANGIEYDPDIVAGATVWHRADGARAMRRLLDSGVEFDAVLGFNDTLALGAMHVLQEDGFRVPEDVAVMGFDDLDEAAYSQPSLTTIEPGREWIARTAVEALLERIAPGGSEAPPRTRMADFSIIERESTSRA